MLGSSNNFFIQQERYLTNKRVEVYSYLLNKGFTIPQINVYLKAYDYFCRNPKDFDGATAVKDLVDIEGYTGSDGLDLKAMLHDYYYVMYNVGANLICKIKADKVFGKGIVRMGGLKRQENLRVVGLILTSILIIPYAVYKRGFMTKQQKQLFNTDYNIFK